MHSFNEAFRNPLGRVSNACTCRRHIFREPRVYKAVNGAAVQDKKKGEDDSRRWHTDRDNCKVLRERQWLLSGSWDSTR